jgi:saccharopine dehydrogenase (NAD+, L-lysine-forming)
MRILDIGPGAMAQAITRDLLESGVDELVVAGHDARNAKQFVKRLHSKRAKAVLLDARDPRLADRISAIDPDVVINSSWYELNMKIMPACIEAGVHYIDLGGLYHMTRKQLALDTQARDAGVLCLLGMGSTPGIMNVMARHAAEKFTSIDRVRLRSGSRTLEQASRFVAPYSIRTVLDEFTIKPVVLRNGRLREVPSLSLKESIEFPKPVGRVEGYVTLHSELATLPRTLGRVRDMDFIVAYDPEFTSFVATLASIGLAGRKPLQIGRQKIVPYDVLAGLVQRLPPLERDPVDADAQRVEMLGVRKGKRLAVRMDSLTRYHKRWGLSSGTADTGIPPSIAAQWIASGRVRARGVLPPESCIEPLPFFRELNRRGRGIKVFETVGSGRAKPLF